MACNCARITVIFTRTAIETARVYIIYVADKLYRTVPEPMKICIVCPYNMQSAGGVQAHIHDSANELVKLGHSVTVLSPGDGSNHTVYENYIETGKCRRIVFNQTEFDISFAYGADYRKLKELLHREQFDIIHYHTLWTPFLCAQVLWLSETVNIATFHDTPPDTVSGKLTRIVFVLLGKILYRMLDAMIAVSPAPAGHLPRNRNGKLYILPPCTSLEPFRVHPAANTCNDDTVTILFLGRLEERKGIFVLLSAFRKLQMDGLDVRLRIAGSGRLEEKIRQYIRDNNISNIELLGAVRDAEKVECYSGCDIFCSPAIHGESFGIVLVEAMAAGKPVIAAENKGYINILNEKKKECLCIPGSDTDLYEKLKKLVTDRNLRQQLGKWGAEESRKYDCCTIIPALVDIYRKTLDQ